MLKMLIAFVSLFVIFFTGIEIFRSLTKREKWKLTKTVLYSIVCAVLTVFALVSIVLIF